MTRYLVSLTAALAISVATPALAQTVLVDFEADSDGNTLFEGDDGSSAFAGVVFSLDGISDPPVIATEGAPYIGWTETYPGDGNGQTGDVGTSGVNSLTDELLQTDIRADFDQTVSEVSLHFWDWGDCVSGVPIGDPVSWSLDAYDAGGVLIASTTHTVNKFAGGSPDDGRLDTIMVATPGIAFVVLNGLSQDCGTAIDDFLFVVDDGDTVPADEDLCQGTVTDGAAGVPSSSLGSNRWAWDGGASDGAFMQGSTGNGSGGGNGNGKGNGNTAGWTMTDTQGCSCADLIELCGYGMGHTQFGCSNSVMEAAGDGGPDLCAED